MSKEDYIARVQRSTPQMEEPYLVVPQWILEIEDDDDRHYVGGYWRAYHFDDKLSIFSTHTEMHRMGLADGKADREWKDNNPNPW